MKTRATKFALAILLFAVLGVAFQTTGGMVMRTVYRVFEAGLDGV